MKIKRIFFDQYGATGYFFSLCVIAFIVASSVIVNMARAWQCGNYTEVTGRDSKYISFDSCYVKTVDGGWIRYDSNYKN